ncbi:ATP-binding protein [Luteolibacter sp. SL250]|uniref:ATP-binding protein n=1 Tax=Luteolibacter sp. SL250 TaxID=2995170 RepID=UPI00226F5268|nr:ATP-binding protein [Luteolibacter sp. SL250]WAC21108.1 ATP-binding protein [Luteolibacter sp. SL250]
MTQSIKTQASPENIGHPTGEISVELSTRFLEHFSEQMYSSPQKAFEELISNSWDAGADYVDVRIPDDLSNPSATMSVLDNGHSMNEEGLRQLWHIAFSPKKGNPVSHGRKVIGKFGIGKLATYVLASKMTYICRAADGVIRRVTMDYGSIDAQKDSEKLIRDLKIDLFEVNESEVSEALGPVEGGAEILEIIAKNFPTSQAHTYEDEFGAPKSTLTKAASNTWTLVILSELKPAGRALKKGILGRMLQAALPFGSEMGINMNGSPLTSSKAALPKMKEWQIGPGLGIDHVEIYDESESPAEQSEASNPTIPTTPKRYTVTYGSNPVPHANVEGIGMVTGCSILFEDRVATGKSEERGASNGFSVNILGRVVNQGDPSFGEKNLSHAAWARFRMNVRADGLNDLITTDREKFKNDERLLVFRAFLRRVFNKARSFYDSDANAGMPDGGDLLVKSLGVLSLNPLRNVVSEALRSHQPMLPGLFDERGIGDREAARRSWQENTGENIKSALDVVKYEKIDDDSFVQFRISDNTIVVNSDHPFVVEHSRSKAEKELMRTMAMVSLLSDVFALDIGIEPAAIQSIREYRDRLMRFRAMQSRSSGTHIAKLLLQTQHDSDNSKYLEAVLSDALRYLGFHVVDMAKPGEPEGLAKAFASPSTILPTAAEPNPPLYSFSFDAKSTKHDRAATNNLNLAGISDHMKQHKANYALVVAPGFSEGSLVARCTQQQITPMIASDLGKLLEYTVRHGAIPLTKLREMFQFYDPNDLSRWVEELEPWLVQQRPLTLDTFLKALELLKGKIPDALPAEMIAYVCRENLGAVSVVGPHVVALAKGLAILVPDLVGVDIDKIVVNANAGKVAAAVMAQLEKLHDTNPIEDTTTTV